MNNKIFIQIASYRDKELYFTIDNAFKNATEPENLLFCICWQKDDKETLHEYENHAQVKLIKIPYQESKGACWARNLLQQHYNNEKYTLQLDSHHRFIKGWDSTLIEMYNDLQNKGFKKPLITVYLPSYNPEKDPEDRVMEIYEMVVKERTSDKLVLFRGSQVNKDILTEPIRGSFYSAHFAFTTGEFAKEVCHDPELYFFGEEMSISVRAFTYGYDIFHPHKIIAWHEYTRNYRRKQWDDDKTWWDKDLHSKKHYLTIFNNYDKYGLGTERTINQFIEHSGIDFLNFDYLEKPFNKSNEINSRKVFSREITSQINTNKPIIKIVYKELDDEWRNWIKTNVQLKKKINTIKNLLIQANFNPQCLDLEINKYL